jgi:hypothetical protein
MKNQSRKSKSFFFVIIFFLSLLCILLLFCLRNLSRFTEITKNDPLFYDPYMNTQHLQSSILDLKDIQDKILTGEQQAFRKSGLEYPYPEGWNIWPVDFLDTLPQINTITKNYLKNPSLPRAIQLLNLYRVAVRDYRTAVNLHIQSL